MQNKFSRPLTFEVNKQTKRPSDLQQLLRAKQKISVRLQIYPYIYFLFHFPKRVSCKRKLTKGKEEARKKIASIYNT